MPATIEVNGVDRAGDVGRDITLLGAARRAWPDRTQFGCGMAFCGARTVHLDDAAACDLPIRVEQPL